MNKWPISFLSLTLFIFLLTQSSCNKEELIDIFEYQVTINSPDSENKHLDDTIHIHVNFESSTGEIVHHINVQIYNKNEGTVIYNKPETAHIHETGGVFEWHDNFVLSEANALSGHSDWVLEAKVWGHMSGEGEQTKTVEFHVHP